MGGAGRSTRLVVNGLTKCTEFIPIVITTGSKDYVDIVDGVKVYYVDTGNFYWIHDVKDQSNYKKPFWHIVDMYNMVAYRKVTEILQKEKVDILHTNNISGFSVSVWTSAKDLGIPIVHTLRDYHLLCIKSSMFMSNKNCSGQCLKCKLYSAIKKKVSSKVDAVVGVSDFILQKHLKYDYFQNAKVKTYIYNPSPLMNERTIFNDKYRDKLVFGFVGYFAPTKGVEHVLETFVSIDNDGIVLYVYGKSHDKQYENHLRSKYQHKNIVFKGFQSVNEIYSNIDVLIISSLWNEPFPRTLIEAYSYGRPVIATNRGGTNEMIVDSVTGYLYDPDNAEDLKSKVMNMFVMRSRIQDMGKNCLEVSTNFALSTITLKYKNVYEVVGRNND